MSFSSIILIGAPLPSNEARFLRQLAADLEGCGGALILANFTARQRQIDFFVVTASYAAVIEQKDFSGPIFGDLNGNWEFTNQAGEREVYSGENPWVQAVQQKFALSDEMRSFRAQDPSLPAPHGRNFYSEFDAFVCIVPGIHPDSSVTAGNYKAEVRSYPEVLDALQSKAKSRTWSVTNWILFAREHLKLKQVSLGEATDQKIAAATAKVAEYRTNIQSVIGSRLPPLLDVPSSSVRGTGLMRELLGGGATLIVGPSGTTKTFHLQHLAVALAKEGTEVPVLADAKGYRGGPFAPLLRRAAAPLLRGGVSELFDSVRLCGLRSVLLLDAINECPTRYLDELFLGVQAFVRQCDARLIGASHFAIEAIAAIRPAIIEMSLPDEHEKAVIYAYNARLTPTTNLGYLSGPFTNAYDVAVAGRCHAGDRAQASLRSPSGPRKYPGYCSVFAQRCRQNGV
jgi:hypothetical protein